MTYSSTTAAHSYVYGNGPSNDIIGAGNLGVSQGFMSGGGKRAKSPKKTKKKKATKKRVKTPMRKPIAKRTKRMARMRLKSTIAVEKREKLLKKRLKHRKARSDAIDSLASSKPISKEALKQLTPEMKKFISKIPKDSTNSTQLTSWPSLNEPSLSSIQYGPPPSSMNLSDISLQTLKPPSGKGKVKSPGKAKPVVKSKSSRQKKFEEARLGLADILKNKPVYGSKSSSIIKFSDYKKEMTKEKSLELAKSKRKGKSR